jgi:3-dehydro-L-gulonate 2-dehydrogenase
MHRIPFRQVHETLTRILVSLGFTEDRASLCARLFAETSRDGVYTHGLQRFPRFVRTIRNGSTDPVAESVVQSNMGALERRDGRRGAGNLNAWAAMERAMGLARANGVGCVALANTNHWMRGGTYGWQAAEGGFAAICWTNTMPNLPPWGGAAPVIGNNPLILAVPRAEGPLVLDMAMSQFSYGAIEGYRRRGEMLPIDGGFDLNGNLTRDPAAIESSQRALPIGFWKGSGLSVLLDALAAMLTLGRPTHEIPAVPERETGISQVFLAFEPGSTAHAECIANQIVASLHACPPAQQGERVRYPGEQTLRLRRENMQLGIPVTLELWEEICAL